MRTLINLGVFWVIFTIVQSVPDPGGVSAFHVYAIKCIFTVSVIAMIYKKG